MDADCRRPGERSGVRGSGAVARDHLPGDPGGELRPARAGVAVDVLRFHRQPDHRNVLARLRGGDRRGNRARRAERSVAHSSGPCARRTRLGDRDPRAFAGRTSDCGHDMDERAAVLRLRFRLPGIVLRSQRLRGSGRACHRSRCLAVVQVHVVGFADACRGICARSRRFGRCARRADGHRGYGIGRGGRRARRFALCRLFCIRPCWTGSSCTR